MNLKTNPELLPLIEWWEKDGKQTVIWLLVAAIAIGGWYGWKNYRAAKKAAASDAVVNAYTTEEIEEATAKFSGTATGGALKLRLAKNYFDNGRYEEALAQYDELVAKAPDGCADIPAVGRAQCLEAMKKFAEAQAAFDAFATANPSNYLTLTAKLGSVRCLAQSGKKDAALKALAALKASAEGDDISAARIEALETLVKRYTGEPTPVAKPDPIVTPPAKAK